MNPYQMKKEDVLKMLGTDENGLTQNQAKENQKKYGKNELAEGKKKNPFIFTIGFDKSDPDHVYVTELLNTTEKKAKLIVAAILAYTGRTDETGNGSISMEPDMLRPMMQQIIREEVRNVLEGQDVSKINREMPTEVDLVEEEPLRMDQTMRQNVVDAISAFRRA